MLERFLIVLSAAIIMSLGTLHIIFTFKGNRLEPRDPQLLEAMKSSSPRISSEMTMWSAWVGFNISHSLCAILFGLIYGYLAFQQSQLLFSSPFLLTTGFGLLFALFLTGKSYWFSIPFRGIALSLVCFIAALVVNNFS